MAGSLSLSRVEVSLAGRAGGLVHLQTVLGERTAGITLVSPPRSPTGRRGATPIATATWCEVTRGISADVC